MKNKSKNKRRKKMEENVNKVTSWEDVLLDNYNQPAQEPQDEQTEQETVTENI